MGLRLDLSNVSKSYARKPVLMDCSVSFDKAGVYIIMGQNGAGKSTFLRICGLLESPDKGEISFYSENGVLNKDIALRRRITLLLPKIGIFNSTVFNNIAYGLKVRGVKSRGMKERVENALDFAGLIHKKNQNALTLSSGEAQRLGIARSLVIEPEILFMDEPTASVDEENRGIIEYMILNMRREAKTIVIITTHDRAQAERLGDKILLMKDGKIIKMDSMPY